MSNIIINIGVQLANSLYAIFSLIKIQARTDGDHGHVINNQAHRVVRVLY